MGRLAAILAAVLVALPAVPAAFAAPIAPGGAAAAEPAAQITIPLTIDYLTLDAALKRQIYDAAGGRATVWKGTNDCEFLYAYNPRFAPGAAPAAGLETDGELGLGVPLGEKCISPISWKGIIAVDATPYLTSNLALMFRVTDINLYDPQHRKTLIVGRGFDLVKDNFIPRFETFKFDLRAPIEEFRALAEATAPPDQAESFKQALATVRGAGPVIAGRDGIRVTLTLSAPIQPAAQPSAAAGPLTPAEQAAWDEQLDRWDAFIVFAIKQLGPAIADKELRTQLLNLLLDGRYRLAQAIDQPPAPGGPDPVRVLFLDQWQSLGAVVRTAAARGQLGDRALEFLSFISAGDALMAFDEAAPAFGARISADDLRRLARIMAPQSTADPLQFNYDQDPELQHLFGFAPPPLTPGSVEPYDSDAPEPTASATPAPQASGATPTPVPPAAAPAASTPAPPVPKPTADHFPAGLLKRFASQFVAPTEAFADAPPQPPQLRQLGEMLKRSVVDENNVDRYTRELGALLDAAAASEIADEQPDPDVQPVYHVIVKAAAWQESCWRQFVLVHGRVRYLESSTHDIGLMQVNRYVWRGFYDLRHIEWDIAYNAGAGSQILARLMIRAAGKTPRTAQGDALARSTYAAYNGGPGEFDRWRRADEPADKRLIDASFWQKYRALKDGQSLNILKCEAEWGRAPGH
jgi:hypothetical protein